MSRARLKNVTRPGYDDLGVTKEELARVKAAARSGQFDRETLQDACGEFPFAADWLILSVCEGLSFDRLEFANGSRIPVGRSDFYSYRRKMYASLVGKMKQQHTRQVMGHRTKGEEAHEDDHELH